MNRFLVFFVIVAFVEIYAFQSIKTLTKNKWLWGSYFLPTLAFILFFILIFWSGRKAFLDYKYLFGIVFAFSVLKLFIIPFLLGEDIFRGIVYIFRKASGTDISYIPSRRKFVSQISLGVASIPFLSLLYGMAKGKYDFRVFKHELTFDDLPEEFDGFTITQISDMHCGSFDNAEKVNYAIDLINNQNSDVIFFTGDLVNDKASEITPWKSIFSKLKAKEGVFSILGNHDYGDYYPWNSEEEKEQNLETLKQTQKELGFDLILNQHRFLEKNGERIAIIGVENWGKGFRRDGDLDKAMEGTTPKDFKILLSHDPTHWEQVVLNHSEHIHLTLSGHTHGMQFGIEIPGFIKWSPSQWAYKYWAGLYKQKGQYINVNRGLGFIGFPGRVGIWPEVSVITLKKTPA